MNSIRFQVAEFADWCIRKFQVIRHKPSPCHLVCRAVFTSTEQRPRIFTYTNVILCSLNVIVFSLWHGGAGVRQFRLLLFRWIFYSAIILEWIIGGGLIWAYKERKAVMCKLWCLLETCIMTIFLLFTLLEIVLLSWPRLLLLASTSLVRLYGLWVIYYFSLECASGNRSRRNHEEYDKSQYNEPVVEYRPTAVTNNIGIKRHTKPPPPERKETNLTSISSLSPPLSPNQHGEDLDSVFQFHKGFDSKSLPSSPVRSSFIFLNNDNCIQLHFSHEEPQNLKYSEILMDTSSTTHTHTDNNIIRCGDLMCGGTSTINVNNNLV